MASQSCLRRKRAEDTSTDACRPTKRSRKGDHEHVVANEDDLNREWDLLNSEYGADIIEYHLQLERDPALAPDVEKIDRHRKIRSSWRAILIDYLSEIQYRRKLRLETLFVAVDLLDRYMTNEEFDLTPRHYQLVGVTTLYIASKLSETPHRELHLDDLVQACDNLYKAKEFRTFELRILKVLNWRINCPDAVSHLLYLCCTKNEEDRIKHIACYLLELSLCHKQFIRHPASCKAQAALLLARVICGQPIRLWNESADIRQCFYALEQIQDCSSDRSKKFIVQKYSQPQTAYAAFTVIEFYKEDGGRRIPSADSIEVESASGGTQITDKNSPRDSSKGNPSLDEQATSDGTDIIVKPSPHPSSNGDLLPLDEQAARAKDTDELGLSAECEAILSLYIRAYVSWHLYVLQVAWIISVVAQNVQQDDI
ncbi:hypothetical protein NEOLEDRAFT_1181367 [Neolentinus lepideus HHB14362 ss-1]|uniref:Uncharacterized protein n=1 Tax=Neolentinus lepideus HHB14362 ss-1 TaxID=1314782 RepID=A0A165Q2I4_9AGAM|nr:hypothetical protein NEOLEDRAFT_1181367 [Neolentinus lepideus HHB14362 ss-1]